ncbi:MAG: glycosyltransferase family 2 protein [Verrucomicrobiae bacterium]|nr:glycosyltransferase family 2 protein [Verrucomicrobiae bacterium]
MKLQFFITRAGNHFMQEIAEFYVRGLQIAGYDAELILDQLPQHNSEITSIVVAPHEFFPLFVEKQTDASGLKNIASRVLLLNTEQPGTSWFKKTVQIAAQSRGVIDFNQLGIDAFHQYGVPALYWPIPYTDLLECPEECKKEIDFVFLGYASSRRTKFFAKHAEFFSQFENRFIFSTLQEVRTQTTPGCCFGEARNWLLKRSKILVNIHSSENRYFEWHRALVAIANGCVFVTDESERYEPLIHGEHLMVTPYDRLQEVCVELIVNNKKREAILQAALAKVKEVFSPEMVFGSVKSQIKELVDKHDSQRKKFALSEPIASEKKKIFFDLGRKKNDAIKLIPKRDIKIAEKTFLSVGEDPQFRLQKSEGKWEEGWHVLSFQMKALEGRVSPEVYVTARGDFRDSEPIAVREIAKGKFRQLIRLTSKTKEVRLDPMSEEGEFELSRVDLEPLEKDEKAVSLLLDYFQDKLSESLQSHDQLQAQRFHFLLQQKLSRIAALQGLQGWEIEKNAVFDSVAPTLSVVVTLYNYEAYIEACLTSVDQSTLSGIEIIVVDDASQDLGVERVSTWMKTAKVSCALVKKVFNTGLAASRNLGIELSRAPYVFILDADNYVFPKGLENLYRWVREKNWNFGFGILQRFDSDKKQGIGLLSHYEWNEKHLLQEPYIDAMALFKKEALLACEGYQIHLASQAVMGWEDYDLWLRLLEKGFHGGLFPNFVGGYRVHAASMIRKATAHLSEIGSYFQKRYAPLIERCGLEGKAFGWIMD